MARRKLLYHAPFSRGGMADYGHRQAGALAQLGVEVIMLCPADGEGPWHHGDQPLNYQLLPRLRAGRAGPRRTLPAPLRKLRQAAELVADARTLAAATRRLDCPRVLMSCYFEYVAPIWAGMLRRLTRERGTVFGSVVQDPVRDHQVGPEWWHRWSIAASYSVLREAFVHTAIVLDTVRPMPGLRTTVIPHGPYEFTPPRQTRAAWRAAQNLPADAGVLLSFGHLRDGKNLDLSLRALARCPDLHLVVAGKEQSGGQKPAAFYRRLAQELGVEARCRWLVGFIPEQEVSDIFNGCDLVLLTYSAAFHSASGVLNATAPFRLPFLASGGEGNLRQVVQRYAPDAWVEPDDLELLCAGLARWRGGRLPAPRWEDYAADNSWRRNAEIVAAQLDLLG